MTPSPAMDDAVIKNMRDILSEREAALTGKFVTKEEAAAALKACDEKLTTLIQTQIAEAKSAQERLIKERTARPPGALIGSGADADMRTLGQRFAETDQFKALMANPQTRGATQMSVAGRMKMEQKAVTVAGSGFPVLPTIYGTYPLAQIPPVVRDLLTVVTLTGTNAVEFVRETWTWNADYQLLEGDKKAESTVTYTPQTEAVRTIATFVKVSRQMIADVPYFMSTVDQNLMYAVAKKEDTELLWGTGAAGHLHGLMPQAPVLPAGVLTGGTQYQADVVLAAIAYLANTGYAPTGIVMNPVDWANMQISKTAQGVYVLGGPPSAMAAQTLWGVSLVTTPAMTAGKFLVGSFPANAALFDREVVSVELSYENEDDFVRNMATIRAEERVALAVFRPQAFVQGVLAFTATAAEGAPHQKGNNK